MATHLPRQLSTASFLASHTASTIASQRTSLASQMQQQKGELGDAICKMRILYAGFSATLCNGARGGDHHRAPYGDKCPSIQASAYRLNDGA
jgi:hypothetical protein